MSLGSQFRTLSQPFSQLIDDVKRGKLNPAQAESIYPGARAGLYELTVVLSEFVLGGKKSYSRGDRSWLRRRADELDNAFLSALEGSKEESSVPLSPIESGRFFKSLYKDSANSFPANFPVPPPARRPSRISALIWVLLVAVGVFVWLSGRK